MVQNHYNEILTKIHGLQDQLENELDQLVSKKREEFQYKLNHYGLKVHRLFYERLKVVIR